MVVAYVGKRFYCQIVYVAILIRFVSLQASQLVYFDGTMFEVLKRAY